MIRVGVFDQIVSAGGVHRFTIKLLEECAKIADGKWQFKLMWPLFDSGNEFLTRPTIQHTSFERIAVYEGANRRNKLVPIINQLTNNRLLRQRASAGLRSRAASYQQQARQDEQRILRSGGGSGLRWLDQRIEDLDLIYMPYPYLTYPGTREWRPAKPLVITLHDLAHEHTDTWGDLTEVLRWETRQWIEHSSLVIFSSDYTKTEAMRIYGLPEERARRIYLGPTEVKETSLKFDVLRKHNLKPGYVFTIGWAAKHKRVDTIIEGFALFKRQSGSAIPLVIAGPNSEQLVGRDTHGLEVGRDVFALGFVPDEEVPSLYRHASMIVTASVSEAGLNAMIFDALYYGKPVACSNIPQFVERLGTDDRLALTFDPYSPASLADALHRHFADTCAAERRTNDARQIILARTWSDVARDYLDAFESVL